jgi:hypothetical protein
MQGRWAGLAKPRVVQARWSKWLGRFGDVGAVLRFDETGRHGRRFNNVIWRARTTPHHTTPHHTTPHHTTLLYHFSPRRSATHPHHPRSLFLYQRWHRSKSRRMDPATYPPKRPRKWHPAGPSFGQRSSPQRTCPRCPVSPWTPPFRRSMP